MASTQPEFSVSDGLILQENPQSSTQWGQYHPLPFGCSPQTQHIPVVSNNSAQPISHIGRGGATNNPGLQYTYSQQHSEHAVSAGTQSPYKSASHSTPQAVYGGTKSPPYKSASHNTPQAVYGGTQLPPYKSAFYNIPHSSNSPQFKGNAEVIQGHPVHEANPPQLYYNVDATNKDIPYTSVPTNIPTYHDASSDALLPQPSMDRLEASNLNPSTSSTKTVTAPPSPIKRRALPHLLPVQFQTENINRITFFVMSCLVTVFINIPFGAAALLCSVKSHKLMLVRSEESKKAAKRFGQLAFFLNVMGIIFTMITLITVFLSVNSNSDDKTVQVSRSATQS